MTGDSAGADRSTKTTAHEIHDQSGPSREATSEAIRALKDATGVHSYMGTFDQKHFKQVLAGKSDVERAEIEKGFSAFGKNLEEVIREKLSGTEQKEALNLLKHKNGDITSRRVEELDLVLRELSAKGGEDRQSGKHIRGIFASSTHEQIEQMDALYRQNHDGKSLLEAIKEDRAIGDATKAFVSTIKNGAEARTDEDTRTLAHIALDKVPNLDLFAEAMSQASNTARADFIKEGGEDKLRQAFPATKDFGHAMDYAKYGKLSAATQIKDNTGSISFSTNCEALEASLESMSARERELYNQGKAQVAVRSSSIAGSDSGKPFLSGVVDSSGVKSQETKPNAEAIEYYETLNAALLKASGGNKVDLLKWEGQITSKGGGITSTLAKHYGLLWNDGVEAIERDIKAITPEQKKQLQDNPESKLAFETIVRGLTKSEGEYSRLIGLLDGDNESKQPKLHDDSLSNNDHSQYPIDANKAENQVRLDESVYQLLSKSAPSAEIANLIKSIKSDDMLALKNNYAKNYQGDLQNDVLSKLDEHDKREIESLFRRQANALEQAEYVRKEGLEARSGFGAAALDYFGVGTGAQTDDNLLQLNKAVADYQIAKQKSALGDTQKNQEAFAQAQENLSSTEEAASRSVALHQASKASAADIATDAAIAAVGIGGSAFTLGGSLALSSSILVAGGVAATSGAVKVSARAGFMGASYNLSTEQVAKDFAIGAVGGIVGLVGPGQVACVLKLGSATASRVSDTALQSTLGHLSQSAKDALKTSAGEDLLSFGKSSVQDALVHGKLTLAESQITEAAEKAVSQKLNDDVRQSVVVEIKEKLSKSLTDSYESTSRLSRLGVSQSANAVAGAVGADAMTVVEDVSEGKDAKQLGIDLAIGTLGGAGGGSLMTSAMSGLASLGRGLHAHPSGSIPLAGEALPGGVHNPLADAKRDAQVLKTPAFYSPINYKKHPEYFEHGLGRRGDIFASPRLQFIHIDIDALMSRHIGSDLVGKWQEREPFDRNEIMQRNREEFYKLLGKTDVKVQDFFKEVESETPVFKPEDWNSRYAVQSLDRAARSNPEIWNEPRQNLVQFANIASKLEVKKLEYHHGLINFFESHPEHLGGGYESRPGLAALVRASRSSKFGPAIWQQDDTTLQRFVSLSSLLTDSKLPYSEGLMQYVKDKSVSEIKYLAIGIKNLAREGRPDRYGESLWQESTENLDLFAFALRDTELKSAVYNPAVMRFLAQREVPLDFETRRALMGESGKIKHNTSNEDIQRYIDLQQRLQGYVYRVPYDERLLAFASNHADLPERYLARVAQAVGRPETDFDLLSLPEDEIVGYARISANLGGTAVMPYRPDLIAAFRANGLDEDKSVQKAVRDSISSQIGVIPVADLIAYARVAKVSDNWRQLAYNTDNASFYERAGRLDLLSGLQLTHLWEAQPLLRESDWQLPLHKLMDKVDTIKLLNPDSTAPRVLPPQAVVNSLNDKGALEKLAAVRAWSEFRSSTRVEFDVFRKDYANNNKGTSDVDAWNVFVESKFDLAAYQQRVKELKNWPVDELASVTQSTRLALQSAHPDLPPVQAFLLTRYSSINRGPLSQIDTKSFAEILANLVGDEKFARLSQLDELTVSDEAVSEILGENYYEQVRGVVELANCFGKDWRKWTDLPVWSEITGTPRYDVTSLQRGAGLAYLTGDDARSYGKWLLQNSAFLNERDADKLYRFSLAEMKIGNQWKFLSESERSMKASDVYRRVSQWEKLRELSAPSDITRHIDESLPWQSIAREQAWQSLSREQAWKSVKAMDSESFDGAVAAGFTGTPGEFEAKKQSKIWDAYIDEVAKLEAKGRDAILRGSVDSQSIVASYHPKADILTGELLAQALNTSSDQASIVSGLKIGAYGNALSILGVKLEHPETFDLDLLVDGRLSGWLSNQSGSAKLALSLASNFGDNQKKYFEKLFFADAEKRLQAQAKKTSDDALEAEKSVVADIVARLTNSPPVSIRAGSTSDSNRAIQQWRRETPAKLELARQTLSEGTLANLETYIAMRQNRGSILEQDRIRSLLHDYAYFIKPAVIPMGKGQTAIADWLLENVSYRRSEPLRDEAGHAVFENGKQVFVKHSTELRPSAELASIVQAFDTLSEQERRLPYSDLLVLVRSKKYYDQINMDLAQVASFGGTAVSDFRSVQTRFLASRQNPTIYPMNAIWTSSDGKLEGRFIRRDDARGLYLGSFTDCCQYPQGAGASAAFYGQEKPHAGYFVITDKTTVTPEQPHGVVVAQSFVWARQHYATARQSDQSPQHKTLTSLVFDSIEGKSLSQQAGANALDQQTLDQMDEEARRVAMIDALPARAKGVAEIYAQAFDKLSEQYHQITVGTSTHAGNKPLVRLLGKPASDNELVPRPSDLGYSDADSQYLVRSNPDAVPPRMPNAYVQAARSDDSSDLAHIAKQVYPDGWQTVQSADDTLVLHLDGRVVGYTSLDYIDREVTDLAILPEYRNTPAVKLLADSMRRIIKERGGEWSADFRDSTSYPLIMRLAQRGTISILEDNLKPGLMAGEDMHAVKFVVNED